MADWDDVCLDPYAAAQEQGRQEGREAGLVAGYRDGYDLGVTKGVEAGMEVGFWKGVLPALHELGGSNERAQKTLDDLERALDNFPDPDAVFANIDAQTGVEQHHDEKIVDNDRTEQVGDDNDDSEKVGENDGVDIQKSLQAIRARFKLLTVQLGIPYFSLKQVMEDDGPAAGRQPTIAADW